MCGGTKILLYNLNLFMQATYSKFFWVFMYGAVSVQITCLAALWACVKPIGKQLLAISAHVVDRWSATEADIMSSNSDEADGSDEELHSSGSDASPEDTSDGQALHRGRSHRYEHISDPGVHNSEESDSSVESDIVDTAQLGPDASETTAVENQSRQGTCDCHRSRIFPEFVYYTCLL